MARNALFQPQRGTDIQSLIIPLGHSKLLLPSVSVAEIMPYRRGLTIPNSPDWVLGKLPWRGYEIPLLSLEILYGEVMPGLRRQNRIVVLNYTGCSENLPFFAIMAQAMPKLARVVSEDIELIDDRPAWAYERATVRFWNEKLVVPDIGAIERAYLAWSENEQR